MTNKKFTFKTEKATGRYREFSTDIHNIKYNNIKCGLIGSKKPHKIRLQVIKDDINEDSNTNCPWKWVTLKHESTTLTEAKEYLNEIRDIIFKKYKLYLED